MTRTPDKLPFLDPIDISIAHLPSPLDGFRILHVTDLHVRKPRRRQEEVLAAVAGCEYDLLAITGDSMVEAGDEPAAAEFLTRLVLASRAKVGVAGVWGNHDTAELRTRCAHVPIRWLVNTAWSPPGLPLTLLGVDCARKEHVTPRGDLAAALSASPPSWGKFAERTWACAPERSEAEGGGAAPMRTSNIEHPTSNIEVGSAASGLGVGRSMFDVRCSSSVSPRCRILLAHMPTWLPPAAAAGIDLVLSGHTHGGQLRLPTGHILYNATPGWPCRYSCGLLQLGTTQCLISRGLGEVYVPGLRFFCKPQLPLITLRRAEPMKPTERIVQVRNW